MVNFNIKRKLYGILYPPGVTVIDTKIATALFLILVRFLLAFVIYCVIFHCIPLAFLNFQGKGTMRAIKPQVIFFMEVKTIP